MRLIDIVYRERPGPWTVSSAPLILNAEDVMRLVAPQLSRHVVEVCVVLCLDAKHGLIGCHELTRGSLTSTIVDPRQVFQVALLANAAAVILVHNHPSGDPTPSPEDRALFSRLTAAASVMGISVLDSVIVGGDSRFSSMREERSVMTI